VKENIERHLEGLKVFFYKYYFQRGKENIWTADPFNKEFFKEVW
jgi:heterodisulfide reductase subunit B